MNSHFHFKPRGFGAARGHGHCGGREDAFGGPATGQCAGRGGRASGFRGGFERAFGGGAGGDGSGRGGRMFAQGGLKLLVLHLLAQQPAHGYELIKAIEELVGGDYSPSPGTIYPTLTWLTELGYATVADSEGGRKQYAITDAGREHLAQGRADLDRLLARLQAGRAQAGARGAPEIRRAMGNVMTALRLRFEQGVPSSDLARRVAEVLDRAAVEIERL